MGDERFVTVAGRVELLAVGQSTGVVHGNSVTGLGVGSVVASLESLNTIWTRVIRNYYTELQQQNAPSRIRTLRP